MTYDLDLKFPGGYVFYPETLEIPEGLNTGFPNRIRVRKLVYLRRS